MEGKINEHCTAHGVKGRKENFLFAALNSFWPLLAQRNWCECGSVWLTGYLFTLQAFTYRSLGQLTPSSLS
jgi:hypothetical protein